ncbi:unnamed protein product, partial [Brassica rapa subsp. narinosa]
MVGSTLVIMLLSTEHLIRLDQEELSLKYGDTAPYPQQYPPQPEVEFGFPQVCYCGRA